MFLFKANILLDILVSSVSGPECPNRCESIQRESEMLNPVRQHDRRGRHARGGYRGAACGATSSPDIRVDSAAQVAAASIRCRRVSPGCSQSKLHAKASVSACCACLPRTSVHRSIELLQCDLSRVHRTFLRIDDSSRLMTFSALFDGFARSRCSSKTRVRTMACEYRLLSGFRGNRGSIAKILPRPILLSAMPADHDITFRRRLVARSTGCPVAPRNATPPTSNADS
jgi:hypothetical protein